MRRFTLLLWLCLLLALTLGAALGAPAGQAAEYGRCFAKANGEYTSNTCTQRTAEAESGSYEWESPPAALVGYEGKIGESVFSDEEGTAVCKAGIEEGGLAGAKITHASIRFKYCSTGGHPCSALFPETEPEEVRTYSFETDLLDHGEKGPGGLEPQSGEVWLSAENAHGLEAPWLDKWYCQGLAYFEVDGYVSGPITPVNVMASSHRYVLKAGVDEQGLKTTVCADSDFYECVIFNLPSSETYEGTLYGEMEIRSYFAQPPTVKANAASEISTSSAVLNATVNPNGQTLSECEFEYGPTTAYGKTAACSPSPGSKDEAVKVSASLTGLAEDSTYHFRIVATNAAGMSYSADQGFGTFLNSKSAETKEEKKPAKVEDGPVAATASEGTGTVTVGQYGSNPGGVRLFGSPAEYVDVYVSTNSSFKKIEYKDCELHGASTLEWFNPEANGGKGEWQVVTKQTYVPGSPDCIDAVAEASGTSPTIAQMSGTRYGGASTVEPPEFGRCVSATKIEGKKKLYEGFFTAKTCLEKGPVGAEGEPLSKYEWEINVLEEQKGQSATHFTLAASAAKLETAAKAFKITCTGVSGDGEYTGPKALGDIALKLTGCSQGSQQCTSNGASAGEIKTKTLEGALGWESQPSKKAGLELYPQSGAFAEFSCGSTSISVKGAVIAPIKANKMSATPALKFKGAKGAQKPEAFEGGPKAILEESSNGGSSYAPMDLSASIAQTNEGGKQADINTAF